MLTSTATRSLDIPKPREVSIDTTRHLAVYEQRAAALLTPPDSLSPEMSAYLAHGSVPSPTPFAIEPGASSSDAISNVMLGCEELDATTPHAPAMPLSRGALSGLNATAAITPALLAKHHLPTIMLGHGPKPIRDVMGELTQTVPGFSRIPPAKARRLVVAALESRNGGGVDGNVAFYKTGWGRWDAQLKHSSRDSAIGSFNENRMSPPRSERSGYAMSHTDSGVHMHGPRLTSAYRGTSGGSRTASSLREEDEMRMDMDVPENEADKMSLDGISEVGDDSEELDDDTDDEEDWAAVGPAALRKASLPTPGAPRRDYNALSSSYSNRWSVRNGGRRPSGLGDRLVHSASVPKNTGREHSFHPGCATPDEKAAIAALLSLGSM